MKTQQRVEKTVMQILYDHLLLDMPHPVAARKKVTKEIIELFDQQTIKLKLINAKQGELIELLKIGSQPARNDNEVNTWQSAYHKLLFELVSLQEGQEKSKYPTSWRDFTMTDKIESKQP